jgi:hypothetical protein
MKTPKYEITDSKQTKSVECLCIYQANVINGLSFEFLINLICETLVLVILWPLKLSFPKETRTSSK